MSNQKAIAKAKNSKGTIFVLVDNGDGTYTVLKLSENYDGRVRGGLSKRWVYLNNANNVSETEARKVYNRRVAA
jgi:hypothetical protein